MMKATVFAFTVLAGLLAGGCSSVRSNEDLAAFSPFEAERYMGTWHEIARLPQRFQEGMTEVTATYSLEGDRLKILNAGTRGGERRSVEASGYFAGEPTVGLFRVTFFWPFYGDYKILWVSSSYDRALVTSGDRSSLWLLARTPTLEGESRAELLRLAEGMGFDVSRLEWSSEAK